MSQKKIIIWSLVAGLVLNLFIIYLTSTNMAGESIGHVVEPTYFQKLNEYFRISFNGGFPIPYNLDIDSFRYRFFGNFLFWSFIVWLILTIVVKLKKNKRIESSIKY